MSRLVLRKRSQFRRRPTPSFWNSNVPPFDEAIKNLFGRKTSWGWLACIPLALVIVATWGVAAHAQDAPLTAEDVQFALNNIWITIAAFLVIFMNAGFGMLETGFCRQKNAVNVLSKNLVVFALATLAYWFIGFSLMFGANGNSFVGWSNFFLGGAPETYGLGPDGLNLTKDTFFLFQVAFAGTAATIVSGAVAERIKFVDFIVFSLLLVGIAYPITGHWLWGGGWLLDLGFHDFAGSTIVHSVGGWAALMGAAFLGPRIGKYQDGQINALPGHNLSIATLGCLILWLGWFGFNPGSQLAADTAVPYIAVTTNIAAAAGGVAATVTSWALNGKPDLSMIINGILAGLVGVTAGCFVVGYGGAFWIGLIAGILVVFAVGFFDSIKIDDPVGALSVHLVCGIWGTLAVGLFANPNNFTQGGEGIAGLLYGGGFGQLGIQLIGVLTVGLFTVVASTIFWLVLKAVLGLRVAPEEELKGLDIGEHGMEAYSGFLKDTSDMGGVM
ncbi:ammonium transporter [Pseudanabaena sp. FACHB-2040]|uniref:ammonium transporter n=1 Tax=Pseudanabaena sp. FACHB-2040 TaxID=2692859 RepID=UPI00168247C8|nr:ammonium transporter [Pseudanabaena sp. FACHB-2040]MBD2258704.1 ammonium transporter [Pseudanabaena sp. FACHB-2040]